MLLTHQKGGIMYWKRVRVYSGLCKNYFQDCFKVVVDDFEWATEGLLISLIGLVGLLGNVISIWKFSRQKVHRIFHNLLLCLAVFDVVTTYLYRLIFCWICFFYFALFSPSSVSFRFKKCFDVTGIEPGLAQMTSTYFWSEGLDRLAIQPPQTVCLCLIFGHLQERKFAQ